MVEGVTHSRDFGQMDKFAGVPSQWAKFAAPRGPRGQISEGNCTEPLG
jgi:hypothetical protein